MKFDRVCDVLENDRGLGQDQIKQDFKEIAAAGHEMALVDYPSSDDEPGNTTRAREVHLNPMSLNFMLNEPHNPMEKENPVDLPIVVDIPANGNDPESSLTTESHLEEHTADFPSNIMTEEGDILRSRKISCSRRSWLFYVHVSSFHCSRSGC
jgi:hypothetical protein